MSRRNSLHRSLFHRQIYGRLVGFTLIELLVVISVIGILIALIVPAVQAARETARKAGCTSNLNQIGIALISYESTYAVYPFMMIGIYESRFVGVSQLSELAAILPYLDNSPLYSSINFAMMQYEWANSPTVDNHTARNTKVAAYLCPSDGEAFHLTNYRLNRGTFGDGKPFDGPFGYGFGLRTAMVTDGLSRTAFVSERMGGSFRVGGGNASRDAKYPMTYPGVISSDEEFISYCLAYQPDLWNITYGRYWIYTGFEFTHYNHNGTPNDRRPTCAPKVDHDWGAGGLNPPRSFHYGTVGVLFGDGHAESVTDSINGQVWKAMGTYANGD
jgi:prepilin-type N-terminal cleavage/methylation domain-containing protein/prepilin-type processing-associated H-X9-DG protein